MSFSSNTEEYYKKFIELQEKLRKSEQERLNLEIKFNEMVRITREEEQVHYRKLRSQYQRFLEEDRYRQDRNERILKALERIESRVAVLVAKTERFKLLRKQYQSFLNRVNRTNEVKKSETVQKVQRESENKIQKENENVKLQSTENYGIRGGDRGDIVQTYLQTLSSNKLRELLRKEDEARQPISTGGYDSSNFRDENFLNHANYFADDIMNSIYLKNNQTNDSQYGLQRELNNNLSADTSDDISRHVDSKGGRSTYFSSPSQVNSTSEDTETDDISEADEILYKNPKMCNVKPESQIHVDNIVLKIEKEEIPKRHPENEICQEENLKAPINGHGITEKGDTKEVNGQATMPNEVKQEESLTKLVDQTIDLLHNKEDNKKVIDASDSLHPEIKQSIDVHQNLKTEAEEKVDVDIKEQRGQKQMIIDHMVPDEGAPKLKAQVGDEYDVDQPRIPFSADMQHYEEGSQEIKNLPQDSVASEQLLNENDEQYKNSQQIEQFHEQNERFVNDQALQKLNQENQLIENYNTSERLLTEQNELMPNYAEYDQPLQNVELTQQQHFDEQNQDMQEYDEHGQLIQSYGQGQYDENGQFIQQYNEHMQFDENGQVILPYDENGQLIPQYDENGLLIPQYDENGQLIPSYDENGHLIPQYDEHGQMITYDQYDEHGQSFQYTGGVSEPQYDENGQLINQMYDQQYYAQEYDETLQPVVHESFETVADENLQPPADEKIEPQDETRENPEKENIEEAKKTVMELLDTDSESVKQDTKVSHDSDFDFSNG